MIVGDLSHLHIYEQGGSAQVWLREKESQHTFMHHVLHFCIDMQDIVFVLLQHHYSKS